MQSSEAVKGVLQDTHLLSTAGLGRSEPTRNTRTTTGQRPRPVSAPPSQQPRWRHPNSPEPKKARKFYVSLNHTPFESRTSQKAPFAPRATIGGSTTLRGSDFSPATYNSLSDPHLNPYFARKFGKSASLRETGLSRTKGRKSSSGKTKKKGVTYKVIVKTGAKKNGGTDAKVFAEFRGTTGKFTRQLTHQMDPAVPSAFIATLPPFQFHSGSTEHFTIRGPDVGELIQLIIQHDGRERKQGWFLDEIQVTNPRKPQTWTFPCYQWLSLYESDCQVRRSLKPLVHKKAEKVVYVIEVYTGDKAGAGTDAHVFVTLYGKRGQAPKTQLISRTDDAFERNKKDVFKIKTTDLGPLKKLTVEHDNFGFSAGWFLDKIIVYCREREERKFYFPCNQWLAKDEGDGLIVRQLTATTDSSAAFQGHQYLVHTFTGDKRGAGTDANVVITIFGEDGDSGEKKLDNARNNFERGKKDSFKVMCGTHLGRLTKIRIGHDNSGLGPGWFLNKVTVEDPKTGDAIDFPCRRWFAKNEDDGQISRELSRADGKDGDIVTDKGIPYHVHVTTGDVRNASTNARVYVILHGGEDGESNSGKLWLQNEQKDNFEKGRTDIFTVETTEMLSPLHHLTVGHDNTGLGSGWYCEKVVVDCPSSGHQQVFLCQKWLADDEGDQLIERDLYESEDMRLKRRPKTVWNVWVWTSDMRGAGTDSNVFMTLYGDKGKTDEVPLGNATDNFEQGQLDKFKVELTSVGKPYKLRIRHDNSKPFSDWHLEKVYEGVAKMGFTPPEVLADHDVILTTYSTLRSDFYHLGSKQGSGGRSLRYDKRYVALPSPLTGVMFWRICLDEAQMVESTTAKAAEVALHLNSVHRWCVTGTPIQKGLEDIYGLLLFLGVDPYSHQKWWKTLLYEPYRNGQRQPLYDILAKIMWRSAKKDVIHEIQLPDQDEKVKWLTFSPVEQHFYRRQHEECAGTAMKMLSNWEKSDTMLSAIDRHTVHQLLNPLLRLRQACCHPQAVRGGFLSMQKSTLTMDKLLESLIAKAKLECEEAHRQLLFAFNGLAGVHILKEEWPEAVDMYREAMRSWTEHENTFRTDALQKLHTLFNLSDVLSHRHPGCSNTLRDDKLPDEVKELKNVYTTRVNVQVTAAQQNLDVAQTSLAEIRQKVDIQSPWWIEALQSVVTRGMETDLCFRIKDELSSTDMDLGSIGRFKDLHGLQYLVSSKLDLIESTHKNLLEALNRLIVPPSSQMVQASAECCLRPAKDNHSVRCAFCQVDDIFTEYESRIFGHQGMKGVDDQDLQPDESLDWHRHGNTGGLRADSEVEKVLRVVHSFIKTNKTASTTQLLQEGRLHLNIIEGLRKEFKFLRALWFALHERISCLDELDMCTTRLRLLLPGEPVTDDIHVIHPLQVEQQRLKFMSDRVVAQTELRKKLGQLLYLNNLAKTQTCHDGKNPEPCPVCTKQLGVQWSVFSCGHCICCQCAWVLLRQAGIGPRQRNVHVKCPMCRIPTLAQEISYVSTAKGQTKQTEENVTVKGSHSTKVEAVVRTLLTIKLTDTAAKCLVFSTWQEVLGVLAKALDENGIKYRHITGSRHFQSNLQTFKQDSLVGVLLLPLQTGSNGLNIIEATHVLLVEPALNPAHELQAVGRVHRIGQTKRTHVYRFIIRGTVESRMYSLLQSKPTGCVRPGARDSENSSLTLGDLASLFTQDEEHDKEQCMPGSFGFQKESELSPEGQ